MYVSSCTSVPPFVTCCLFLHQTVKHHVTGVVPFQKFTKTQLNLNEVRMISPVFMLAFNKQYGKKLLFLNDINMLFSFLVFINFSKYDIYRIIEAWFYSKVFSCLVANLKWTFSCSWLLGEKRAKLLTLHATQRLSPESIVSCTTKEVIGRFWLSRYLNWLTSLVYFCNLTFHFIPSWIVRNPKRRTTLSSTDRKRGPVYFMSFRNVIL